MTSEPISAPLKPASGDKHVTRDGEDYAVALSALIPQGQAWPRAWDGVLMKVVRGLTRIWGDFEIRASALLEQESDPRTTLELLPDWERNWGLPDPCYEEPQTIGERQFALVQRMTIQGAQSREFFIGIAADIGYTITISEYRPFYIAMDRCGDSRVFGAAGAPDPIMRNQWHQPILNARGDVPVAEGEMSEWPSYGLGDISVRYHWTVHIDEAKLIWFRVGSGGGQTGVDPHLRIGTADDLECLLERWKPGHTDIIFDYSGIAPPKVSLSTNKVFENAANGTVIGEFFVENKFTGTPTFTLADDAGGKFAIINGNELVVNGPLDYEVQTQHTILVNVLDIDPIVATTTAFVIDVEDVAEPRWVTVFQWALDFNHANWNGYNFRQGLVAGFFSHSGTKFRLTLQSGTPEGTKVSGMFAGHAAATPYNYDGTQKQITVGGVAAFTIPSAKQVVTDEVVYNIDKNKPFNWSMHFDSAANDTMMGYQHMSGAQAWTNVGASTAGTTAITGHTNSPGWLYFVTKIEIWAIP
jgi:uncharacterized protein YmfQ (DUF2313 family)